MTLAASLFGWASNPVQKLILGAMNKSIKLEQTRKAYKTAHEVGLMTIANVVLGFPRRNRTDCQRNHQIRFLQKLNPEDVGFYVATPYPGTPMYEQVIKNGWLRVNDFDRFDTAGPTFETPQLSMEKLAELRYKAYQHFYLRPSYVLTMMRHRRNLREFSGENFRRLSADGLCTSSTGSVLLFLMIGDCRRTSTNTPKEIVIDRKFIPIGDNPKNKPISPVKPKLKATDNHKGFDEINSVLTREQVC